MDFYKLYEPDSCEELEHQWSQVIAKYDMLMNKHVNELYQIKQFGYHVTFVDIFLVECQQLENLKA